MKKILLALGAMLCAVSPALAQGTNPVYSGPGGTVLSGAPVFLLDGSTWYTESVTPLAAGATVVGAARQTSIVLSGANPVTMVAGTARHTQFFADVYTDQAGTLYLEKSTDGGQTWVPENGTAGTAVAAGTSVQLNVRITALFYRARFTCGSTAQALLVLSTALVN